MPGPFALADRVALRALVEQAGFEAVSVEALEVRLRSPSFEQWWARTAAVAGPVASLIAGLDAPRRRALDEQLRAATAPYTTDGVLDLPGLTLIGAARRGPL